MIPLSGGRRLAANSASIATRRVERDRDPVDRVGRQGDDPAGPERLDRRRAPGRRRRRDDPRAVMPRDRVGSTARLSARASAASARGVPRRADPPGTRGRAARSAAARPPRSTGGAMYRAAARTAAGAVGIAAPWPTPAIISRSLNWSPIARTRPSGTRARRARCRTPTSFETPGARNSRNRGWLIVTAARPANRRRPSARTDSGIGSLAAATEITFEIGWREPRPEIRDDLGPGAEQRGVVLGPRVVGLDDEPLEMVDVRLEPDALRPGDDLAGGVGGERPVGEDPAEARIGGSAGGSARTSAPW